MVNSPSATEALKPAAARPRVEGDGASKVALRLEALWKTYPGSLQPAVQDLSLDVQDGEIVTLLGPSGCGKTTTLRIAARLDVPDEGDIFFGDRPVQMTPRRVLLRPDEQDVGVVC